MSMIHLCLTLGVIASLLWILADRLIVGFVPQKDTYQDYLNHTKHERYIQFLDGSNKRLAIGALLGNFTAPLYVFSSYAIYLLTGRNLTGMVLSLLAVIAFVYTPMAHCSFYYTAMMYKLGYRLFKRDGHTKDIKETTDAFQIVKVISWSVATLLTIASLGTFGVIVLMGKTLLPSWFCIFNPMFLGLVMFLLALLCKGNLRYHLISVVYSLPQLIFYLSALIYCLSYL